MKQFQLQTRLLASQNDRAEDLVRLVGILIKIRLSKIKTVLKEKIQVASDTVVQFLAY